MCGRYGRRGNKQKIAEVFHANADNVDFEETDDAAPGSIQPVIKMSDAGERDLALMRWGFKLPQRLLFNTRSDTATTSKFWKEKLADKRCIIPASSFFEWEGEKGNKTKYEITVPRHHLFGMAGVWALWKNPKTEKWENTYSIFTTDNNALLAPVHDRQPVILQASEYDEWLAESERPPVHLLRVFPADKMRMTLVEGERPAKGLFDSK